MKKKRSEGRKTEGAITVEGYCDGKPREKRLVIPKYSHNWYVFYYNFDLKQRRISADTAIFEEALAYLKIFDPFNPKKPDPLLYTSVPEQDSEIAEARSQSTIAFGFNRVISLLKTNAIEGRHEQILNKKPVMS